MLLSLFELLRLSRLLPPLMLELSSPSPPPPPPLPSL
jgi:hypothetical protein